MPLESSMIASRDGRMIFLTNHIKTGANFYINQSKFY